MDLPPPATPPQAAPSDPAAKKPDRKGPIYFAAHDNPDFGADVIARVEKSDSDKITAPIRNLLAKARLYYFGFDVNGIHGASTIARDGEVGELAKIRVNHARALVNTVLNLVISDRVAWIPKATNVDYASIRQCEIAKSVLEYYFTTGGVERLFRLMCEKALYESEGFILGLWDETAGEELDGQLAPGSNPDAPKAAMSGDFTFEIVSTDDVIRDSTKRSWDALEWVLVRVRRNKFSLAVQYPDHADKIHDSPADSKLSNDKRESRSVTPDDIPVYLFFHKPTPAVPGGREAVVLSSGEVIKDGSLSYADIPLHRTVPGELDNSPYGYTPFFEILSIQEYIDSLESSAATNLLAFGTQNVVLPSGTEIEYDQVAGGMRILRLGPDGKAPAALQLCATPRELYEHLAELKRDQELLFGVNQVVRGQEQNKDLSGAAMALLESQVQKQASGLHGSYRAAVQSLGTALITELKRRASAPRTISLVGQDNSYLVEEESFTGETFGAIKRVLVDLGNPLSQSVFGRMEMAKELVQMGLVNNMEQFFMLLDTGRAEPITQGLSHELQLIKSENEDMAKGIVAEPMLHDNHLLHCREHRAPVASPLARKDPKILNANIAHIHKHYELFYGVPPMQPAPPGPDGQPIMGPDGQPTMMPDPMYRPRMLALMGLAPPDPALGGIPQPPGGPPPPGNPNEAAGSKAGPPAPPPPVDAKQNTPAIPGKEPGKVAAPPKQPNMPKQPATGQEWDPATSGGVNQP